MAVHTLVQNYETACSKKRSGNFDTVINPYRTNVENRVSS